MLLLMAPVLLVGCMRSASGQKPTPEQISDSLPTITDFEGGWEETQRLVLHLGDRVWRKCREHHDDETSDSEVAAVPAGGSNRGCLRCI